MNGQPIPRPEIGARYRSEDGLTAEVRAVSSSHVVCDAEQVYSREDFARFFMGYEGGEHGHGSPVR